MHMIQNSSQRKTHNERESLNFAGSFSLQISTLKAAQLEYIGRPDLMSVMIN